MYYTPAGAQQWTLKEGPESLPAAEMNTPLKRERKQTQRNQDIGLTLSWS